MADKSKLFIDKSGFVFDWGVRFERKKHLFYPGERIIVSGVLHYDYHQSQHLLIPFTDDNRYADKFYLESPYAFRSGTPLSLLIKVKSLTYQNILIGYANDYLVEVEEVREGALPDAEFDSDHFNEIYASPKHYKYLGTAKETRSPKDLLFLFEVKKLEELEIVVEERELNQLLNYLCTQLESLDFIPKLAFQRIIALAVEFNGPEAITLLQKLILIVSSRTPVNAFTFNLIASSLFSIIIKRRYKSLPLNLNLDDLYSLLNKFQSSASLRLGLDCINCIFQFLET